MPTLHFQTSFSTIEVLELKNNGDPAYSLPLILITKHFRHFNLFMNQTTTETSNLAANWTQKFKKGKCVASSKVGQLWFDLDNYTRPSPYNSRKLCAAIPIRIPFPINSNPNTNQLKFSLTLSFPSTVSPSNSFNSSFSDRHNANSNGKHT